MSTVADQEEGQPPLHPHPLLPHFFKKRKNTEGRKADRASRTKPSPPLSSATGVSSLIPYGVNLSKFALNV